MPKRINLSVDKLVGRASKQLKIVQPRPPSQKPITFQQLFRLAKNSQSSSSTIGNDQQYWSATSSTIQHQQSNSQSVCTPQNSSRNWYRTNCDKDHKLNRSLQTKSHSLQKINRPVRSFSNQKIRVPHNIETANRKQQVKQYRQNRYSCGVNVSPLNSGCESEKFEEEFRKNIDRLDHENHSHLRQTQCFLSIDQTFKLLKSLHYLRKIQDQKHLVRLWQLLQGDTYGGIPSQNLYQFLLMINGYAAKSYYSQQSFSPSGRSIIINSNLKIVASATARLQIYEQFLALRVNRILYGSGDQDYESSDKKMNRTSNIKIVEDQGDNVEKKAKGKRLSFGKKKDQEGDGSKSGKRAVRLRSGSYGNRQKKPEEQELEKDKSEETICYSQISQTKQSGKNLSPGSSQSSIMPIQIPDQPQRKPILSIDVNLGEGLSEKLLVYEGQTAVEVSRRLVQKYKIDESLRLKFQTMLSGHIKNLLWRIEEVSEDMFSDREE